MKKLFLLAIIVFTLSGCTLVKSLETNSLIVETSEIQDFKGKPSVIVFGGTYCSHCVKAIPLFKTNVWDMYNDKANLWVNVVDQKRFDVKEVAQGFNPNLTFEKTALRECNVIPSWVVLDEDFSPVLSSCGGEKAMEDMVMKLPELVK